MGIPSGTTSALLAGRFELGKLVGSGGMGTVYRAHDHQSGKAVAIKLLRNDGGRPEDAERFEREAQLLAELRHPGIVAYVAHGQTDEGQPFLAMEWLDGHDLAQHLAQHLAQGPMPMREALRLVQQIAEALRIAHARGIAHRDLKPSNLFLVDGDARRLKLLDFGIARRMAAAQAMTRTGTVVGTPEYMAPEQARGVRELTSATDIFSVGCLLYECITGEPPFRADHLAAVLVRILFEELTPLSVRCPEIPPAFERLIADMLKKDPQERIPDADALLARLRGLGEIPDLVLSRQPVTPKRAPSTFAEEEQVLFSLVVATAGAEPPSQDATLPSSSVPIPDATQAPPDAERALSQRVSMLAMLQGLGAHAEYLLDGALVVRLPQAESAQDQVAMAARIALLIKERWSEATVAVTTGRGTLTGSTTVGDVASRAVKLLSDRSGEHRVSSSDVRTGVWVDELSVRLLGSRFAVSKTASGALLISEEKDSDESRRLLGKTTPFVGRDTELAILEARFTNCIEESTAQALLVTAPPGFGKSRLRHEFLRRLAARGQPITTLLGRGDFMSAGAAYGILRNAICRLCGISGSEPDAVQQKRLRQRVSEHLSDANQERVVAFLGELCGIPFPAEDQPLLLAARQEPKIMRDSVRHALHDWLAAECAFAPLVLFLDDMQWGDDATVSALDALLDELRDRQFLIVAFARPEIHQNLPRLWQGHGLHEIPLKGLGKKACERLVQQVLDRDVAPALVARVIEQSAGNALYLEELIRGLSENQSSEPQDTVLAMLQARIGRLSSSQRKALLAASVFGQTFWAGGVATILGLPRGASEVEAALNGLSAAELILSHRTSRLSDEKEYAFRHALVRDAAYSLLTERDQQTGHRLAAEFLAAGGDSEPAVLAEHYELAGESLRAAGFYLQAAEASLEQGDFSGAERLAERGLACGPQGEVLGLLHSVLCIVAYIANRSDRAEPAQALAMPHLRPGSLGWCRVLPSAFGAASKRNDTARATELMFLLFSTDPDEDAQVAYVEAVTFVSWGLMSASPPFLLDVLLQRMTSYVKQAALKNPAIRRHLHNLLSSLAMMRQPRPYTHLIEAERALPIAGEVGDRLLMQSLQTVTVPAAWMELGDGDRARKSLAELEARTLQSPMLILVMTYRHTFGKALCELGSEEALVRAEKLVAPLLERTGTVDVADRICNLFTHEILARVALGRGQLELAIKESSEAMSAYSQGPVWIPPPAAVHIRALLGLRRNDEAIALAEQILPTLTVLGSLGCFELEFRVAASEAFHAAGNVERAKSELRETLHNIKLRADDITDPIWRQSFLTRNPSCARASQLAEAWQLHER